MHPALILLINFALISAVFAGLWAWSRTTKDPSFVDAFWAFGMVILALSTFFLAGDGWLERKFILTALTLVWGLRLGLYLFNRWREEGEDKRYKALIGRMQERRGWSYDQASGFGVFLPQAVLLYITCLPIQLGQIGAETGFGLLALLGFALAVFGIAYEAIADWQLSRFKADPANDGKVMDQGLWAWSRHPNYFGEICTWWGIFLIAAETSLGVWSFVGPAFLTFTLLRWSGVPLLEKGLKHSRPGYGDYAARTSAVFPWPPKANREKPEADDIEDDTTEYDGAV